MINRAVITRCFKYNGSMFDAFEYFYRLWELDPDTKFVSLYSHIDKDFLSIKYDVDLKCFDNFIYADPYDLEFNKVLLFDTHDFYNINQPKSLKLNKLYVMRGKELIEVDELCAGDIGALSKLTYTQTNDSLCANDFKVTYKPIKFSKPYYGKAIKPDGKANEEKITNALNRILEEDKTLIFESNPETKQQCLYGLGDIHIDTIVSKLKENNYIKG